MDPGQWGPSTWNALHYIALGYPTNPTPDDMLTYKKFFELVGYVLPCKLCSEHYKKHWTVLPIDSYLSNRMRLFEWTVKIHNIVNKLNGKKEWTLEEAKRHYLNGGPSYSWINWLLILIIFGAVTIFFWRNKNI